MDVFPDIPSLALRARVVGAASKLALGVLTLAVANGCGRRESSGTKQQAESELRGRVLDGFAPVSQALVRIQGRPEATETDESGCFVLEHRGAQVVTLAASKDGYFIATANSDASPLVLSLRPLPQSDNPQYAWVDPTPDPQAERNCGNCHAAIYGEWRSSGHARSAQNRRFQNLYSGRDWDGNELRGWSLLADHPAGAGVCSACHAPGAGAGDAGFDDMRQIAGVAAQGVHCDFCHKIRHADPAGIGLAHGRFAYDLLRPESQQVFLGPLDDANGGDDAFSPLYRDSQYCAGCHEGIVFGEHVYSTYSEWLDSPARKAGLHCQHCHMRPSGTLSNLAPEAGGIPRDPATLASHTLLPGGRAQMLRSSLGVRVAFDRDQEQVTVRVEVVARNVGHRVPTGFIDRHLLLAIEPQDAAGATRVIEDAPRLPAAAGPELAGRNGRLFGRLLSAGGEAPVPFWRPHDEPVDSRLAPEVPIETRLRLPDTTRSVRVRLLYRRFWPAVRAAKDWPDDTIVVYDETIGLN